MRIRRLAVLASVTVIFAPACSGETMSADLAASTSAGAATPLDDGADVLAATAKRRCIDGVAAMERRIEEEGFEWPEDEPELTEDELHEQLTPDYDNVDGVASPDQRPEIELMGAFDPETVPILDLDRLVGACLEGGIVSEAELFGDDEFDDEDVDDDE